MASKKGGGSSWLVTFADLMSLLMAVFVLLFAMSTLEVPKYRATVESLREALSHSSTLSPQQEAYFNSLKTQQAASGDTPKSQVELYPLYESLLQTFAKELQDEGVKVDFDPQKNGIKVTFPEQIAFAPGSADLKPDFVEMLARFKGFKQENMTVKVIGHTDRTPVLGGRFKSNWELSSARAASVVSNLIERGVIRPEQAEIVGMADNQPLAHGDTPADYAKNRRVDVLIFSEQ
ncbi:MAG: flagellar motor protein MotB [Gammaproteobacteria bacterium]|nr:flagellar motor protein MotB [Gammaproteobacteria bacterium]